MGSLQNYLMGQAQGSVKSSSNPSTQNRIQSESKSSASHPNQTKLNVTPEQLRILKDMGLNTTQIREILTQVSDMQNNKSTPSS